MNLKTIDGLPVLNAKEPLILKVTPRDIRGATNKDPASCAIAKACKRQLHVHEARIHLGRIYLRTNSTNWVRYITPASTRNEIIAFDRGGTFEPTELRLQAMNPSKQSRQGERRAPHIAKGKPPSKPHVVTNVRGGPA